VLSLFLIPVLYASLARFTKPTGYIARSLGAMESEQPAPVPAE